MRDDEQNRIFGELEEWEDYDAEGFGDWVFHIPEHKLKAIFKYRLFNTENGLALKESKGE